MTRSIRKPDADRLARELAATTEESLTDAELAGLSERLERERKQHKPGIAARLRHLAGDLREVPVLDPRPPDEVLWYDDDDGLPA